MNYGANEGVQDKEAVWCEKLVEAVKACAAKLVASGDMTRTEAVNAAAEGVLAQQEAQRDVTGTLETLVENQLPRPSREVPGKQVVTIKGALDDLVEEKMRNLNL